MQTFENTKRELLKKKLNHDPESIAVMEELLFAGGKSAFNSSCKIVITK